MKDISSAMHSNGINMQNLKKITTSSNPKCMICGTVGEIKYPNLTDRLFGAPGKWTLKTCLNSKCGLLWLDPMPDQSTIHFAYENYYTHHYESVNSSILGCLYTAAISGYLDIFYKYRVKKARYLKLALGALFFLQKSRRDAADFRVMWQKFPSNKNKLLEVGCGNGDALVRMQNLGWEVTGVDFDPKAAETARKRGVNVLTGSLQEQNFISNSFDVITLSHLIEHVHNPLQLIEKCYDLLSSQGRVVILTPNSQSLLHRIFKRDWKALEPPRHLHIFNTNNLAELAKKAGFKTITIKTITRDANGIFMGSMCLTRHQKYSPMVKVSILTKAGAFIFQLIESVVHIFNRKIGEELVLIAIKD